MSERLVLNHKIHVLSRKEELDTVRVAGKVALSGQIVIVLDVLFATSTIITAMAHGARRVIPAMDPNAARIESAKHPRETTVLAGELRAERIEGFGPPSPLALLEHGVRDKTIVYSTTNGTIALNEAAGADAVYAGALLNGAAVVDHVLTRHTDSTLLIICSGSLGNFNIEDYYGAGYLVELLAKSQDERVDLSDAARAARALFRSGPPVAVLADCRVGRMMASRGLAHEVEYAAQLSTLDMVPRLDGSALVPSK